MPKCIVCGKENDAYLCRVCRAKTNPEELCNQLIRYMSKQVSNSLWDEIRESFPEGGSFKDIVFEVSQDLPPQRRDYFRIMALSGGYLSVSKQRRGELYQLYQNTEDADSLSLEERNRLHGLALAAYYMDYEYDMAEDIASVLYASDALPWQAAINLADYYTITRRYDLAEAVLNDCWQNYSQDPSAQSAIKEKTDKNAKQKEKAAAGKQQYLPNPQESKEFIRKKYIDFLSSIGIDATISAPAKRPSQVIPRDQYPLPKEIRKADFDDFVAFDLETTGLSPTKDSIIEIGAIKVIGGKVSETKQMVFQEFVKPLDSKKVSADVLKLTGISNEDVRIARPIWEVFPDFVRFTEGLTLVGFNCMAFDSKFMVRAGRYSNLILENPYFDVMRYAKACKDDLNLSGSKQSLATLAKQLGVKNPRAHRALADAITTAKVFLKLRELKR